MGFVTSDSATRSTSYTITSESSLVLRGTSNVGIFSCSYEIDKINAPIPVTYNIEDGKLKFDKTALVLENACFDCGGKGINSDFQKLLKSVRYPQISLFLKEVKHTGKESDVRAIIDLEIVGITKSYKIPVKIKKDKGMLVTGDLGLYLSDFNLEAPKKLFGLIVVHDKIDIFFQLAVHEN